MVRYVIRAGSLAEPSGGWLSVPADRRPRGLALPRLAEWSVLKLGGYDPTAVAWRLPEGLHLDQAVLLGGAPQYCTRVLQLIAVAPGEHGGGTRASYVGAVMKVRAGLFHTPAEPRRGGCRATSAESRTRTRSTPS